MEPQTLSEEGILADAYRDRKLLERCVENAAMEQGLSIREALVLLALGKDGYTGRRRDLAALAGLNRSTLYHTLQQLGARGFVRLSQESVAVLPPAREPLAALEKSLADYKALRFADFTPEETEQYKALHRRVRQNVRRALE